MATWAHLHLPRLRSGETPDVISVKIPGQRVEYASWISLRNIEFKVFQPGRQRCILEGVRNVHAWVVGEEVLRMSASDFESMGLDPSRYGRPAGYRQAVYDPWKGGAFVDSETLEPVLRAELAILSGKNVYYASE